MGFPGGSDGKESACNAGDLGSILGSGRAPGEGNSYLLQYSCLENSMYRGAWKAIVPGVAKSWTQLRNQTNVDSRKRKFKNGRLHPTTVDCELFKCTWTLSKTD